MSYFYLRIFRTATNSNLTRRRRFEVYVMDGTPAPEHTVS
jgi:hypothetical protein